MAFDPALGELVLFGGLASGYNLLQGPIDEPVSDTWAWNATSGSWTNLTGSITGAPPSRYAAGLSWDAAMGGLVLFGGNTGTAAKNDTWSFRPFAWSALSESVHPSARWGASFTNSSLGYDLLFGGQDATGLLGDTWMFANGQWYSMPSCPTCSPPARSFAASAAIPANGSIVVFGGTGTGGVLGDTWVYTGSDSIRTGPEGNWTEDTSLPSPPGTVDASSAADFHRGVIVEFGGALASPHAFSNATWGYFHLYARLSVEPTEVDQGAPIEIIASPFGGNAPFTYLYTNLPPGCLPANSSVLSCTPDHWGIYSPNVTVIDARGRTTSTNGSVQVDPPGASVVLRSEFSGVFYTGFPVNDTFGVDATVWGERPTAVTVFFGGTGVPTQVQPGGIWNFTEEMSSAPSLAPVRIIAQFANWTLRASAVGPAVVAIPSWLRSIEQFPTVRASFAPTGSGPWGNSYNLSFTELWGLGELALFDLPTSFLNGSFQLLPIPSVDLSLLSSGRVTLFGGLTYPPSGLTFGPFTIALNFPGGFSAALSLEGVFSATASSSGGDYSIAWTSAWLNASLGGSFNVSYPIAGITIPDLGTIGFSLDITIAPSVALSLLLAPAGAGTNGFLTGLGLTIERLLATLTVQVTAAVTVGIGGVASLSGGGDLSLALLFGSLAPYFLGVWLNGSMFLSASFLGWTVTYTFLGPGTIWSWSADPPANRPAASAATSVAPTWVPSPRYYNVTGYDALQWNPSASQGVAVPLLYPATSPALATVGGAQADLLYSSDQVDRPAGTIAIEGIGLNASSGSVGRLPTLLPAGESTFDPVVVGGSGGTAVAVFDAVPTSALEAGGPAGLHGFWEQAATLPAGAGQWGAPRTLVDWGYPQRPLVGVCGGTTEVATIVSPTFLAGGPGPENLVVTDLATGAALVNRTVQGISGLSAFDCADGSVVAQNVSGSVTLLALATGAATTLPDLAPAGATLRSIGFVNGTGGDLLLGYSTSSEHLAIVYDPARGAAVDSQVLPANASEMWAASVGGSVYLFVEETDRVVPLELSGNASTELPPIPVAGLISFETTLVSGAFVVEAVGTNGSLADRSASLTLAFVRIPPGTPSTARPAASAPPTLEYVAWGVLGALVAATAVTTYLWRRDVRRRREAPAEPAPTSSTRGP
jgi:hypothetical protein